MSFAILQDQLDEWGWAAAFRDLMRVVVEEKKLEYIRLVGSEVIATTYRNPLCGDDFLVVGVRLGTDALTDKYQFGIYNTAVTCPDRGILMRLLGTYVRRSVARLEFTLSENFGTGMIAIAGWSFV